MLEDKKLMAINMLIEGKLPKTDIAKACGRSRQWLYDSVINDDESKAKMDRRLQEIQNDGMVRIKSNLSTVIDNIIGIANMEENCKLKFDANVYLANRVYGGITPAKSDIINEDEEKEITSKEELQDELSKYKSINKAV